MILGTSVPKRSLGCTLNLLFQNVTLPNQSPSLILPVCHQRLPSAALKLYISKFQHVTPVLKVNKTWKKIGPLKYTNAKFCPHRSSLQITCTSWVWLTGKWVQICNISYWDGLIMLFSGGKGHSNDDTV